MKIYNYIKSTKTLGPYNRFALWVQGCPFSCTECMSPDSQDFNSGLEMSISEIVDLILNEINIEGLTISGGEPFSQANELVELLNIIKEKKDLGIIIYSGYTLQQLRNKNDSNINKLLEFTDIFIDGQYIDSLNDGISLRGSSNQKIHLLTDRYLDVFNNYYNKPIREIEIHMNNDSMMLVGIPKSFRINNYKISI